MKKILLALALIIIPTTSFGQIKLGIERLREMDFKPLQGKRVGLITNPTGVDQRMRSTVDILFHAEGVKLVALFAPEHGVRGDIPAGKIVEGTKDSGTGVPVRSLYGNGYKPTPEMLRDIDVIVFDIQDNGSRSYTFISTMGLAMEAAAENNKEFMVLDRPNPLGGLKVEGSGVEEGFFSFVSKYNIPYIHGLTVGELAKLLNEEGMLKNGVKCKLRVITMAGWKRSMSWDKTGLHWVPTSPHIPTWETAYYYPITGMVGELGTLQIGIGYTLPFQLFAADWITSAERLAIALNKHRLPGVLFRPIHYTPFYGSGKDKSIHGVQVHITDLQRAILTTIPFYVLQELHKLYPSQSPLAKATQSRINVFDKVMGSSRIREEFIKGGYNAAAVRGTWDATGSWFLPIREKYLLY